MAIFDRGGDFGNDHFSRPLEDEFDTNDKRHWEHGWENQPLYKDMSNYFSGKARYEKGKGWK